MISVDAGERLESVQRQLETHDVSALPVLDNNGKAAGIISRTDLLELGRAGREPDGSRSLRLPDAPAREHMNVTLEVISPDTSLEQCARRMLERRYHRLYVALDSRLVGVVSTREMMDAVAEGRVKLPISEIMSGSLVHVRASDPISLAVDRLALAHKSAVVVMDEGWPVGVFSQAEALACRGADPGDPVDQWMDMKVLCVPSTLPCYRAAAQASAVGVRRMLAVEDDRVVGIVSGLDFARMVKVS